MIHKVHILEGMKSLKTYKRVPYNQLSPISDGEAVYKGKLYATKEDLKYFPKSVRIAKFGDFKKIVRR